MPDRLAWLRDDRARLILLLGLLAALVAYVAMSRTGAFGGASGPLAGAASDCPAAGAPSVDTVSRDRLLRLRDNLRQIVAFDRRIHPYEEGPILAGSAWSDAEPGVGGALPSSGPAAYEMRWWMPSGDDVVADGMVFAAPGEARDFLERASSADCRSDSNAVTAPLPPGGRNLEWRNPEGFAQEDVYLRRGSRVYRVAVVRPGAGSRATPAARRLAFRLVDILACALPEAECPLPQGPGGGFGTVTRRA